MSSNSLESTRAGLESVNRLAASIVTCCGVGNNKGSSSPSYRAKLNPITDEYAVSARTLGVGVSGRVVECTRRATGRKFALKVTSELNHSNNNFQWCSSPHQVLKDSAPAWREVGLHWRTSGCDRVVRVFGRRGPNRLTPDMRRRIRPGRFDFSGAEWAAASPAAKELVAAMLDVDPARRPTIHQG